MSQGLTLTGGSWESEKKEDLLMCKDLLYFWQCCGYFSSNSLQACLMKSTIYIFTKEKLMKHFVNQEAPTICIWKLYVEYLMWFILSRVVFNEDEASVSFSSGSV